MQRIAVLTSGGDAPGMNAAVRAVARTGIYHGVEVVGVQRGFEGLLEGDVVPLTKSSVGGIIHRGGTILRTARCARFKQPEGVNEGLQQLKKMDIDGLVVIGGDGSFKGAAKLAEKGYPVVGVPATIDNDIAGTDETIGFDTAANTALHAVVNLRDTASSHDRLFIVEVMGREAGFLALYVGVASGAEYVVIPEVPFSMGKLCDKLHYAKTRGKTHSLIILAEGVMPAHDLAAQIQDTAGYDARITVLGHIQRGGAPTARDAILASRLGAFAVEELRDGRRGVMAGSICGAMQSSALSTAWETKKYLPPELFGLVDSLSI
ncbi:MAG: 6-phosphofructokinase [Synergistales bacterium]|nr:6-phosphofructokinase [Synergistales bacterium]